MTNYQTSTNDPITADPDTLRRAIALVRALRDPAFPGIVLMLGMTAVGFAVLAFTAVTLSKVNFVPLQAPFVVSGGFGGAALITLGALLAAVQAERRAQTRSTAEMGRMVDEVDALVNLALTYHNQTRRVPRHRIE